MSWLSENGTLSATFIGSYGLAGKRYGVSSGNREAFIPVYWELIAEIPHLL